MAWVVRTRVPPKTLSSAIQEQIRQVSGLPVSDVRTMNEVVSISVSRQRFNMLLMTIFGGSALLLAAIGIYGLMAYSVEQRTQEIGIRLALGAETSAVRNMVVLQGMRLVLIGVAIGIGSAFGLTRFLAAFLFRRECARPDGVHLHSDRVSLASRCSRSGYRRYGPAGWTRSRRCGMNSFQAVAITA